MRALLGDVLISRPAPQLLDAFCQREQIGFNFAHSSVSTGEAERIKWPKIRGRAGHRGCCVIRSRRGGT